MHPPNRKTPGFVLKAVKAFVQCAQPQLALAVFTKGVYFKGTGIFALWACCKCPEAIFFRYKFLQVAVPAAYPQVPTAVLQQAVNATLSQGEGLLFVGQVVLYFTAGLIQAVESCICPNPQPGPVVHKAIDQVPA